MRLICLSDTHGDLGVNIPDGDVFIYAGDLISCFSSRWGQNPNDGRLNIFEFLPHKRKFFVPGNHDYWLDTHPNSKNNRKFVKSLGIELLISQKAEHEGVSFYGFPWMSHPRMAFCRSQETLEKEKKKAKKCDVLITHAAPLGKLGGIWGSQIVSDLVKKVKPKYHIFGHIHECYGHCNEDGVSYYNVSYEESQKVTVIDI